MKKIIVLTSFLFLFIGCSHWLGQNSQRIPKKGDVQIPKEAGEYPKVFEKDILRGTLSPFRSCYDVTFYDLFLIIDIPEKAIERSYNEIYFIATTDFSRIQIDMTYNMDVMLIEFEEGELEFTREFDAIFVNFPRTIKKGEQTKIKVWYGGYPKQAINPPSIVVI